MSILSTDELMKPKIDYIKGLFEKIKTSLGDDKFKKFDIEELADKLNLWYCDEFEIIVIDSDLLEDEEMTNLSIFLGIDEVNDFIVSGEGYEGKSFDDIVRDLPLWKFDSIQSDVEEVLATIELEKLK